MEAASKNRRGRGRPPTIPNHLIQLAKLTAQLPQTTRRGITNYLLATEAQNVLGAVPGPDADIAALERYRPLVDWEALKANRRGACKRGVLTEIGRANRQFGRAVAELLADRACEYLEDPIAQPRSRRKRPSESGARSSAKR